LPVLPLWAGTWKDIQLVQQHWLNAGKNHITGLTNISRIKQTKTTLFHTSTSKYQHVKSFNAATLMTGQQEVKPCLQETCSGAATPYRQGQQLPPHIEKWGGKQ